MKPATPHETRIGDETRSWVSRWLRKHPDAVYYVASIPGFVLAMSGFGLFAIQCLRWLRTGQWGSGPSTWWVTRYLSNDQQHWLAAPDLWLGLHKIVVWFLDLPLWITLTVLGVLLWVWLSDLVEAALYDSDQETANE